MILLEERRKTVPKMLVQSFWSRMLILMVVSFQYLGLKFQDLFSLLFVDFGVAVADLFAHET